VHVRARARARVCVCVCVCVCEHAHVFVVNYNLTVCVLVQVHLCIRARYLLQCGIHSVSVRVYLAFVRGMYRMRHQNPEKFQFKFPSILYLHQTSLLVIE